MREVPHHGLQGQMHSASGEALGQTGRASGGGAWENLWGRRVSLNCEFIVFVLKQPLGSPWGHSED